MKKNFITAVLMTIVTTILLGHHLSPGSHGLCAGACFQSKANGQLISEG